MTGVVASTLILAVGVSIAGGLPEVSWSVMHPTAIDTNYMARVIEKSAEYGGVDSFEVCGEEQKGVNGLLMFERYPRVAAHVDRDAVMRTRKALNEVCRMAHRADKKVYFWHRENLVPKGLFMDVPELLDADGELDMLDGAYDAYLRGKIADTFVACPELDGIVLTLTESEYSVLHNSNQVRYPAVEVVRRIVSIFNGELARRGKRFVLRSFGVGDDYAKIIAGARAASADEQPFEIETKVTQADFVPWLPINPYLKKNPPLMLGVECDAQGEYLGAGLLPAAQVARIREYVDASRAVGVSRYAIRIDRIGRSIFDSSHEVNLAAYMRFIRDSRATEDDVLSAYAARRFGAAADKMVPLMKSELGLVRDMHYIASNLMFHTPPTPANFRIAKAGGLFALFREGESLRNMSPIWSVLHWMETPSHSRILAEKARAVELAQRGLATIEGLKGLLSEVEYARQHRAFANAVTLSRSIEAFTKCAIAYFEEMKAGVDRPTRLEESVAEACSLLAEDCPEELRGYREGLSSYCRELLREYGVERAMRKANERPEVFDFVNVGGIYDDGRVERVMHAAYPEAKKDRVVRHVGNGRYPNGRITVRLKAPETARIDVVLDPDGPTSCDVVRSWSDGVWTVSVGKKGSAYPVVETISAVANYPDWGCKQ